MPDYFQDLMDKVERESMACIGCNDCLLACPLPQAELVTIAELNAAIPEAHLGDGNVAAFVTACTQCRQCVPACPADLDRADMVLWNKMKLEDVTAEEMMPLQVGEGIEISGWSRQDVAQVLCSFPLFKGVSSDHLQRILLSCTLRQLAVGEQMCREGEYHERLFVVLDGQIQQSAVQIRGDQAFLRMGPGSFYGEMAVLANVREPFTVTATEPSVILELPKAAAYRLMRESPPFGQTMDDLYRRRAAWTFLRSSPLLAGFPDEAVEDLLSSAGYRTYGAGELVVSEGDEPGDVFMVRAGFLRVSRKVGLRDRVLQYFREGDVFGVTALLFHESQSATVVANTRADVLVIPGQAIRTLLERFPDTAASLVQDALKLEGTYTDLRAPATSSTTSRILSLEGLLDEGVVQGHEVLVINTAICTDCGNCVDACERRHGYARLSRRGLQLGNLLFPTACRHCEDPVCLLCTVNGIVREPDGEIRIVPDSCIGCGACAERCPYDNIQMHERKSGKDPISRLLDLVGLHKGRPLNPTLSDQLAVKCDLCFGYHNYACVDGCPVGAAMRLDPVTTFGRTDLVVGLEMRSDE